MATSIVSPTPNTHDGQANPVSRPLSHTELVQDMALYRLVHLIHIDTFRCQQVDEHMQAWHRFIAQQPCHAAHRSTMNNPSTTTKRSVDAPKFNYTRFRLIHDQDYQFQQSIAKLSFCPQHQLHANDMMMLLRDAGVFEHYDQCPYAALFAIHLLGHPHRYYVLVLPSLNDQVHHDHCSHVDVFISKPMLMDAMVDGHAKKRYMTFDVGESYHFQHLAPWSQPESTTMIRAWPMRAQTLQQSWIRQSFVNMLFSSFATHQVLVAYVDFTFKPRRLMHLRMPIQCRSPCDMLMVLTQYKCPPLQQMETHVVMMDVLNQNLIVMHVHHHHQNPSTLDHAKSFHASPPTTKHGGRYPITHGSLHVTQGRVTIGECYDMLTLQWDRLSDNFRLMIQQCQQQVVDDRRNPNMTISNDGNAVLTTQDLQGHPLYEPQSLSMHRIDPVRMFMSVQSWINHMVLATQSMPLPTSFVLFGLDDQTVMMLEICSNVCMMDLVKLWTDHNVVLRTRTQKMIHVQLDVLGPSIRTQIITLDQVRDHAWSLAPVSLRQWIVRSNPKYAFVHIDQSWDVVQSMIVYLFQKAITATIMVNPKPLKWTMNETSMDMTLLDAHMANHLNHQTYYLWLPIHHAVDPLCPTRLGYLAMVVDHPTPTHAVPKKTIYYAGMHHHGQSAVVRWLPDETPQQPLVLVPYDQIMAHMAVVPHCYAMIEL